MQNTTPITTANISDVLDEKTLQDIGLQQSDLQEVMKINEQTPLNHKNIHQFGENIRISSVSNVNRLLEHTKGKEFGEMGVKMNEVAVLVKSTNFKNPEVKKSNIPLIGGLINRMQKKAEIAKVEFATVNQKIEGLMGDIKGISHSIHARNQDLGQMYDSAISEHRQFGLQIAVAKLKLQELGNQIETMESRVADNPTNNLLAQELSDLKFAYASLDKRIGDMMVTQMSVAQTLPTISIMQNNNRMLEDKFRTIYEVTIPAWKNQFMLAWTLQEQEAHVTMSKAIDDTTNEIILHNSNLLKTTAVAVAKSSQRLAIDPETLQRVQENLVTTIQDVMTAHKEGEHARKQAIATLTALTHKQATALLSE